MSALQEDEELGELTAEERAAIDAAHASAVAAGVAPMDVSRIHMFDAWYGAGSIWRKLPNFCWVNPAVCIYDAVRSMYCCLQCHSAPLHS